MLKMSRFTRFSRGKIWFVDIGPCKIFDIFQLCPKPGPNPPNHPESRLFRPKFHLSFSQITKTLGWGGWMGKQIWENFPKKKRFYFFPIKFNSPTRLKQTHTFLYFAHVFVSFCIFMPIVQLRQAQYV